jgi:hypothetical protein
MTGVSYGMSGAEIVAAVEDVAKARGIRLTEFVRPFTSRQPNWVAQVRSAARPKQNTIDRVNALLAGQEVPAPVRSRSLPQGTHRRGVDVPAGERERWGAPAAWRAPSASLATVAADDAELATKIAAEAHRIGKPLTGFLCDLVALGFRCHVEDLIEDAKP